MPVYTDIKKVYTKYNKTRKASAKLERYGLWQYMKLGL